MAILKEEDKFPAMKPMIDKKTGKKFMKYSPTADQFIDFLRKSVEQSARKWELSAIIREGIGKYGLYKDRNRIYEEFGFVLPQNAGIKVGCDLTMLDFLNIFHSDTTGYITGSKLAANEDWKERHYKNSDELLAAVNPKENSYFSINTMYRKQRAVENVREITALWLDLDIYNIGISQVKARNLIKKGVEQGMFPTPTLICNSGRGLYAFWKIEHVPGKSKKVLALWQAIMSVFHNNAEKLGLAPDSSAKDAARVLRVMGTVNSKWDKPAKVLEYNGDAIYTLRGLGEQWYPKKEKKAKKKETRQKSLQKSSSVSYMYNSFTLNKARIADIEAIFKHRGDKKIVHRKREVTLFIYRYYVSLLEGDDIALGKTLELNRKLCNPLSEREVIRATKTSTSMRKKIEAEDKVMWDGEEKPAGYNYSNKTLIEIFDLEQEEMQLLNLSTIISQREKYDRNNERRKSSRRGDDGLTASQRAKVEQYEQVQAFKAQGMTQMQVSVELSVSLNTVKRSWKPGLRA